MKSLEEVGMGYWSSAAQRFMSEEELEYIYIKPMPKITGMVLFKVAGKTRHYIAVDCKNLWQLTGTTALLVDTSQDFCEVFTLSPYTGERIKIIMSLSAAANLFVVGDDECRMPAFEITRLDANTLNGWKCDPLFLFQREWLQEISVYFYPYVASNTGIIACCPDFSLGHAHVAEQLKIEPHAPRLVSECGTFEVAVQSFKGMYVADFGQPAESSAEPAIANHLANGNLLSRKLENVKELLCWRTDKPLIVVRKNYFL
jgi:isoleucyl-tRNA synthetase